MARFQQYFPIRVLLCVSSITIIIIIIIIIITIIITTAINFF